MTDPIYNVLFLCTGNSARSILAEAILNRAGAGPLQGLLGWLAPKGTGASLCAATPEEPEPRHVVCALEETGTEFAEPGAPEMNFVFTVCDNAATEACPVWPGQPMTAHWGVPDPARGRGHRSRKASAPLPTPTAMLNNRISIFTSLPMDTLDQLALQRRLNEIGRYSLPKLGRAPMQI